MAFALIFIPLLMALAAFLIGSARWRPLLLPLTGVVHLGLTLLALVRPDLRVSAAWLVLDPVGCLVLLLLSLLFCVVSFYIVGYLRYRQERSNRIFCMCILAFLGTLSLVIWSNHLGLMWVGIEATALCTAPLIYFNRTPRSIEATWKYMLIGSVGIALALLGSFFLAYASLHSGLAPSLVYSELLTAAPQLSKPWLHAAFVLMLVGYGTKMGLAPMHTWKPDAYGEAPAAVGALLAGGVTSCAFLCILRIYHLCVAAGEGAYASRLLVFMGLLSMLVAGILMVGQLDFKRLLAYSSVEHMGILVLGLGIGGGAVYGSLLHLFCNGLTKGVLFMAAGNIHRAYNSTTTDTVRGALRRVPISGGLLLAGLLAITGSPPFGPFISEFTILCAAFDQAHFWAGGLFLLFLFIVFIGMGATILLMVQGKAPVDAPRTAYRDGVLTVLPSLLLLAAVLLLGLTIPEFLNSRLLAAAHFLEATP
jgi:hydrogenase-4 component F